MADVSRMTKYINVISLNYLCLMDDSAEKTENLLEFIIIFPVDRIHCRPIERATQPLEVCGCHAHNDESQSGLSHLDAAKWTSPRTIISLNLAAAICAG